MSLLSYNELCDVKASTFRKLQNEINLISIRLSEVKESLVSLYTLKTECERGSSGPYGNCFDREMYSDIMSAIESFDHESDDLESKLKSLRKRQLAVASCAVA